MSSYESDRERWLDQELREVPLPEGLIARLKEICAGDDDVLDAAICDVVVPKGLLYRLKSVPIDRKLDRAMRKVVVPAGLSLRLKAIASDSPPLVADEAFEIVTAEAARPSLTVDGRRLTRPGNLPGSVIVRQLRRSPVLSVMVAGSLLAVVALVGLSTFGSLPRTANRTEPQAGAPPSGGIAIDQQSPDRIVRQGVATSDEVALDDILAGVTTDNVMVDSEFDASAFDSLTRTPLIEPVEVLAPIDVPRSPSTPTLPPGLRSFVTDDDDLAVPELDRVEGLVPRGVAPPPVKEYPRMLLIKNGVHPFVSPSVHQELRVSRVPLVTRAKSYHATRRGLRKNRLPPAEEIRPEGFLASVDYQFRRPRTSLLGIRTAAGPSPFGTDGTQLLQVAVQASNGPLRDNLGTALTLAVDVSASMEHGDRLMMVRRALADLALQLGPYDRLSLVAFSERADVLIANAGRNQIEAFVAAVQQLAAGQATNLAAGLQAATDVALGTRFGAGINRRLVLLTDRLGYLPGSALVALEELVAQTAAAGVPFDVVDLGHEASGDPRLRNLARAGRGQMKSSRNVEEIRYALTEILTGQPSLVATGVRLTIQFNPQVVAEYRLLGHEADMVGGLLPGSLEASFNVGETATVLFELRLNSRGGNDVAVADLRWQDVNTGEKHTRTQQISRVQFATTLVEAPLSLQMAAIVAESAEVLRGSVYASSHPAALGDVLEVADTLHSRVYENPSFVEFLTTIEQAHRQRSAKSAPRGRQPNWQWRLPRQ